MQSKIGQMALNYQEQINQNESSSQSTLYVLKKDFDLVMKGDSV